MFVGGVSQSVNQSYAVDEKAISASLVGEGAWPLCLPPWIHPW